MWQTMSTSQICDRSFEFARRVVANEAQEGQTKPGFIAKMSVSRKEAREANFWLRFAVATNVVAPSEIEWELRESMDLLRMIRQAVRTAQSRPDRGPEP
jgi:four helix bundle protein